MIKIIVTWYGRNQTSKEPVFRNSMDIGQTFEPVLKLSTSGTLGSFGSNSG